MFSVKKYTNPEGESVFIPTFAGQPSQQVPEGFTLAKEDFLKEGSADVLKSRSIPTGGVSAPSILARAGLMSPQDKTKQTTPLQTETEVKNETNSLLQPDRQDENRIKSTEPPDVVTSKTIDHLVSQLRNQYAAIQKGSGYKYKNEKELDLIFSAQAAKLAVNGISDIRDVGVEEVTIDPTKRTIRNIQERDGEYFYLDESSDSPTEVKIDPASIQDIRKTQVDAGQDFESTRIEADILEGGGTEKYLINKVTGKRLDYIKFTSGQWRNDLATKGEFAGSLGKSKGTLPLQDRGGFSRWGHQLDVDGQADYAAEFVDGNFITMPVWKDTKTDLTPYMMMASIALAGAGVAGQIGGALAPAGATAGTQLAIGNAVIAGGMTALSGGDLEDVAKAAVISGGMSYVSAGLPKMSKEIGEAIVGKGAPGAMTVGTAVTSAGVNGIAAAIMGQDVGKAMLSGAVQGAVQVNASDFLKTTFGEDTFKKLSRCNKLK